MEGTTSIDDMPDLVLHHIMSYLHAKDAAQTSLLSKKWNELWTSLPCLDFTELQKRYDFLHSVQSVLARRKRQGLFIQRLCMKPPLTPYELALFLDRWMDILAECNIKELDLRARYHFWVGGRDSELHPRLFTIESLTTLRLFFFRMPRADFSSSSLQTLELKEVILEDDLLRDIADLCRRLEYLRLCRCSGFKRLRISHLSQLKTLDVELGSEEVDIEVEARNLGKFIYDGNRFSSKINIANCRSLHALRLVRANVNNEWFLKLIPNLPLLKTLYLCKISLNTVEISSDSLEKVYIISTYPVEAKFDTPKLLYLKYKGEPFMPFVNLATYKVDLDLDNDHKLIEIHRLIKILRPFNQCRIVKLRMNFTFELSKTLIVPWYFRQHYLAPLPNIKQLILECPFDPSVRNSIVPIVDSLLWMAPCLDNLSIRECKSSMMHRPDISMKFIYRKLFDSERCECTRQFISRPPKCWKHSLERLEFENVEWRGADAETRGLYTSLKNYFYANSLLLREIEYYFKQAYQ